MLPIDTAMPATVADWLVLAGRLADNGLTDEAALIRVLWPAIADTILAVTSLEDALQFVHRHAGRLGRAAREFEEQSLDR
jgi:hypothetical protein